jgi:hypothetical protein
MGAMKMSKLERNLVGQLICLLFGMVGFFGVVQAEMHSTAGHVFSYLALVGGAFGLVLGFGLLVRSKRMAIRVSAACFLLMHLFSMMTHHWLLVA